jgi:excinuclease ABC subunit C
VREPRSVHPDEIESVPDRPAVFLLFAGDGQPYLARTSLLRRRLKRLLGEPGRASKLLNLSGVVDRIDYWLTGSQLESAFIHLELARHYFPQDWPRITRLRMPAFVKLTLENPFPRTIVTTRFGRGLLYGPFASRAAAERFDAALLDLFQIRRCEENLEPSPSHLGCIYGEMNKCSRPCQEAVGAEEYRTEVARVEHFLRTDGQSLLEPVEQARDRASMDLQFEEAARLHERAERITAVCSLAGDLARTLDRLAGVAVTPSSAHECVDLWFLIGGRWQKQVRLALSESAGAGQSMDHRLRDAVAGLKPEGEPRGEHLAILTRWHGSSWRDGEWISFEWPSKIPYRKLVNAIARVSKPPAEQDASAVPSVEISGELSAGEKSSR